MQVDARRQATEILGILGVDDAVFLDGARKDHMAGLTEPAAVARMDRMMQTRLVKMAAQRRRDALVDEEPQAPPPARRSFGRPTCGWVSP